MLRFLHAGKRSGLGSTPKRAPAIDPARCLLAARVPAECSRCVDACPHRAIVQDELALGVDTDACTGCGLCQPACPTAAIAVFDMLPVRVDTALAACHVAAGESATVPCIHGIGLPALAYLYLRGVGRIEIVAGDCAKCACGGAPPFHERLSQFNAMLASRRLDPLEVLATGHLSNGWLQLLRGRPENPSRRSLLSGRAADRKDNTDRLSALRSLQATLPASDGASVIYLAAPVIDPGKCTACGLCIGACPERALILDKADGRNACYKIHAESCTGCGLCIDVCESGAVSVLSMAAADTAQIPLAGATCAACGAGFFRPARLVEAPGLCPVCAQTRHHSKLFQVLP